VLPPASSSLRRYLGFFGWVTCEPVIAAWAAGANRSAANKARVATRPSLQPVIDSQSS
jgi:hypothetical protein